MEEGIPERPWVGMDRVMGTRACAQGNTSHGQEVLLEEEH